MNAKTRERRWRCALTGPKLRTGSIRPSGRVAKLKPRRDTFGRVTLAGRVWLTDPAEATPRPEDLRFTLAIEGDLMALVGVGDQLSFTDTRGQTQELRIVQAVGGSFVAEIDRTAYVVEGTPVVASRGGEPVAEGLVVGVPEVVNPIFLLPGDRLILTRGDVPVDDALRDPDGRVLEPAHIHCTLEAAFDQVEPGQRVWFDDGKIGRIVRENDGEHMTVEITQTGPRGAGCARRRASTFPTRP